MLRLINIPVSAKVFATSLRMQQQQQRQQQQQQIIIQLRLIEWCDYGLVGEGANHRNHQKDVPQPSANISLFILLIMLQADEERSGQGRRSWAGLAQELPVRQSDSVLQ